MQRAPGVKSRKELVERVLKFFDQLTPEQYQLLGKNLIEYVQEAHHQGWDGFSSHDMTGIWRFLDDVATYIEVGEGEPDTADLYRQWQP